jgi:L-fucose isomerase
VHHFAAPGKVTLARLARKDGKYWLAVVPGEFVQFPRKVMVAKGATVTPEWPIAFTRLGCAADDFLANFPCNHIHGCYGDWRREWLHVADLLGIEARVFE